MMNSMRHDSAKLSMRTTRQAVFVTRDSAERSFKKNHSSMLGMNGKQLLHFFIIFKKNNRLGSLLSEVSNSMSVKVIHMR